MGKFIFLFLIFQLCFSQVICQEDNKECQLKSIESSRTLISPKNNNSTDNLILREINQDLIDQFLKNKNKLDFLEKNGLLKKMGTGAHGGDPESIEFALIGRSILYKISKFGKNTFDEFSISELENVVNDSYVKGLEFADTPEGQEIRRQYFNLHTNYEVKCALNYYDLQIIELDRVCFREIKNYQVKEALVFHEYLGLLGLEWDQNYISSKLLDLNRRSKSFHKDKVKALKEEVISISRSYKNGHLDFLENVKDYALWSCDEVSITNDSYYIKKNLYNFSAFSNSIKDKFVASKYSFATERAGYIGDFRDEDNQYIDVFKIKDGKIYSIVYDKKDDKESPILFRKCTDLNSKLKSYISYLNHLVKEYYDYNVNDNAILKEVNKVLKSRDYRKCFGQKDFLNEDFKPRKYTGEHFSQDDDEPTNFNSYLDLVFSNKYCKRAYRDFLKRLKSHEGLEQQVIEPIDQVLKDIKKLKQSYVEIDDKNLIDKIYNELLSIVQEGQRFLYQSVEHMYDEYYCHRKLDQKYFLECLIKTTAYGNYVVAPNVRSIQGPKVFKKISKIYDSL